MPRIQGYEEHIGAQGGLNVQANPNDFGAQIGAATQNLGGAIETAAQEVHQYNTTQDVTNVHVNMAKARAEWTKTLQDRTNAAQPGDETFAPTIMKDMGDYFRKGAESATTPQGKKLWATMSADMTSEFGQRAIGVQGDLAAKDAVNKYDTLSRSMGAVAFADASQLDAAVAQGKAAIDDPNGMFAKIPQTTRDKFKQQLEQDAKFAAANGYIERPGGAAALLKSIAPNMLQQFQPEQKLVEANTAPGAKADISKGAMQWAPQVQNAAAAKGLNPNVLLAQIDAESGGNPNAVGPMTKYGTAKGLTQFIDSTAKQYGVDVTKPESAIAGQAAMMSDLLKKYGGDYRKALAAYNWGSGNLDKTLSVYGNDWTSHLPAETSNYIAKIMNKAGAVTPANAASMGAVALAPTPGVGAVADAPMEGGAQPEQPAERTPIATSQLPFMNGLSWEQQNHLVTKAVQLQHMEISNANRLREEQERQLAKQRDATAGLFIGRIIDPQNNGGPLSAQEITNDPLLTWQQKQHMFDYQNARQRELNAAAESKQNPAEVRRLMLQIHAADDDPTKTYNFEPVMESYRNGTISTNEMKFLRTEVEQMKDGNGNNFAKQANQAREIVFQTFTRSPMGQAMPANAASAAYSFSMDMQQKIAEYRKANKDPSPLLDPKSREYLLAPERLNQFMPNTIIDAGTTANVANSTAMAAQAAKVKAAIPTYQDYDKLNKGDQYTDPKGNVRTKG